MLQLATILLTLVLTACGGGGGGTAASTTPVAPAALQQVTTYQNVNLSSQVFNTQVADLNGDGLEDVVATGWAVETTAGLHGKVPIKILIQQTDGSLQDQTDTLLGAGNNMIWGSQRTIVADFDSDGKPDIFLGGFQDGGGCPPCAHTNSVMLWNNGASFVRYDFADSVWAHNVCTGDLNNDGKLDIVANENFYVNNGNRNFTITSSQPHAIGWGACAVVKYTATGNIGIVSTNINYVVPGFTAIVHTYDSHMNWLSVAGLPGSEGISIMTGAVGVTHDIVNIIKTDLNNDGVDDLVLTDNKNDDLHNGGFVALVNTGGFNYTDQTGTYFPTQTNNYYFQYYTRVLTLNGAKSIFVDNVDSAWNFSTLPQLWTFGTSYQPSQQSDISKAVDNYKHPTLYKTTNGKFSLLLIKQNSDNTFTFYTKPV